jgi:hypothetical protein
MILGLTSDPVSLWHRILRWASRVGLAKKLAVTLAGAAMVAVRRE